MITRGAAETMVVPALTHAVRFSYGTRTGETCYISGATSAIGSSEFFPGFVIDLKGLPRAFRSLSVVPVIFGDHGSTGTGAGDILVGTLSAGVMHASASGGTYTAYSTGSWLEKVSFWRQTTSTSTTAGGLFTAVQRDVGQTSEIGTGGLTSTSTSTADGQDAVAGSSSTGFFYYAGPPAVFPIDGAKRFIKCVIRPQVETTGCGSGAFHMSAAAVFGEADLSQPPVPFKRILVTSGCAS